MRGIVEYIDKKSHAFPQENRHMEDREDAQAHTVGRPPASPERERCRAGGGQAPGTLHHVIVRGIEKRMIKDFPW